MIRSFGNEIGIFISSTSNGLRAYRQLATEFVAAQGFKPHVQEHFDSNPGQLKRQIEEFVEASAGVISLMGKAYGTPSPMALEDGKPLSYTQYEWIYSLRLRKPCLILMAEGNAFQDLERPEDEKLLQLQANFREYVKMPGNWRSFSDQFDFACVFARLNWTKWLHG